MEWSIQELVELARVSSRTLRYYDEIGILTPSRIGNNGYRYYGRDSLIRLQRILLLRQLGVGLSTIKTIVNGQQDDIVALESHIEDLEKEQRRLKTQIHAVRKTIKTISEGKEIMAEQMFSGFNYSDYTDEVKTRWGSEVAESAENWWAALGDSGQSGFMSQHAALQAEYNQALSNGLAPDSDTAQQIADRHYNWIVQAWQGKRPTREELEGLAEMYTQDSRFAKNYTQQFPNGAEYVKAILFSYAERTL